MTQLKSFLIFIAIIGLSGCVQIAQPVNLAEPESYSPMPVFYATDRNDTQKPNLNTRFGADRAGLTYGISTVSIPKDYPKAHKVAFLYWNLSLKRNPEKHLAVMNMENMQRQAYFDALSQKINQSDSNSLLFFIHGYNIPFERAIRITAKLAYDLDIDSAATLFSWPSAANTTKYLADIGNIEWSQPDVESYIAELFENTDAKQIYFMAHSLGNRALTEALIHHLQVHPEDKDRIGAVMLAAPDMDSELFKRDVAPYLIEFDLPISLYVSSNDIAMDASRALYGYPRAGDSGENIIVMPGIDTIDASESNAEFFGHEYYSQGSQTIADLYQWIIEKKPPEQRVGLEKMTNEDGTYWRIVDPVSE